MITTDVVIIGSGIAALSIANTLCKYKNVLIITKSSIKSSNSSLAQGGISVALSENDNVKLHFDDTMEAGCYFNDSNSVMTLVSNAPNVINKFIASGMKFDTNDKGELLFGKEAAHGLSRIIHAGGDRTGLKVIEHLIKTLNENVKVIENEMALELRVKDNQCSGVITRDKQNNIKVYEANYTILATGGIGQLYPHTSNDITITGDGIAMAYRSGCVLENLEFVQFHPTMLNIKGKAVGLVSEAVRGEGGILINENGDHIMEGVHQLKDLAPRDVVSREVYHHSLKGEEIFLDISKIKNFRERFPYITQICEENNIDLSKNIIPICPGAHFHMGGIKAKPTGETNIEGLYAVGEVACTGVHGANRLASNSLLEGLIFGEMTAENILNSNKKAIHFDDIFSDIKLKKIPSKLDIQNKMIEFVGIIRYRDKITKIIEWFQNYMPCDKGFVKVNMLNISSSDFEIYNMLTTGYLISNSALKRSQSLGAHCIFDKE